MRFNRIVPVLGAAIVLLAPSAQAQSCDNTVSCSVTNTASVTLGDMFRLSLDGAATALTAPLIGDFNGLGQASIDNAGPTATVQSNRDWKVTVVGTTATFSGNAYNKSAGDLNWEANGAGGGYANDMGASATLFNGNATNGSSKQIMYRTDWTLATDGPGAYSLIVQFTVSAP